MERIATAAASTTDDCPLEALAGQVADVVPLSRRAPILDELAKLDDRGLELAEAVLHQHRQANPDDPYTLRALEAVDQVRVITREMCSYDRDWTDELRNDRRIT